MIGEYAMSSGQQEVERVTTPPATESRKYASGVRIGSTGVSPRDAAFETNASHAPPSTRARFGSRIAMGGELSGSRETISVSGNSFPARSRCA